jgi:chromosome segregation ATPase
VNLTNDEITTEMDDAGQLRAQAAEHRTNAATAQAEADAHLQAARAEAQRLVSEATRRAQQAAQQVMIADRDAIALEGRAGVLDHVDTLRQQIAEAAATVASLGDEADDLTEQTAVLDQRLAELCEQRENTAAQLADATERGDVDQVTQLRARISAVDEVASALASQRQTLQDRLTAIGDVEDIAGELVAAVRSHEAKRAELRKAQNWLNPQRPEARVDAAVDDFRAAWAVTIGAAELEQQAQRPLPGQAPRVYARH